jgi:hypothetical protein
MESSELDLLRLLHLRAVVLAIYHHIPSWGCKMRPNMRHAEYLSCDVVYQGTFGRLSSRHCCPTSYRILYPDPGTCALSHGKHDAEHFSQVPTHIRPSVLASMAALTSITAGPHPDSRPRKQHPHVCHPSNSLPPASDRPPACSPGALQRSARSAALWRPPSPADRSSSSRPAPP